MADYRLQDPQQGLIGPVQLETVLDLVRAGVITAEVKVSRDNGPFLLLSAYAEFATAVAATAGLPDGMPIYAGSLGEHTFFKVFYRFILAKLTGGLVLLESGRRKDVYLENGRPVYVASNLLQERLGQFLLRRGMIEEDELDVALESMHTDKNYLGTTLIRLGIIEPLTLFQELQEHQVQRLIELCTWPTGHYLFYGDMRRGADGRIDLALEANALVLRAARETPAEVTGKRIEPFMDNVVMRVPNPAIDQHQLAFTTAEQRVVSFINGTRTVGAVLEQFQSQRQVAVAVLYLLWEMDAVTFQ